MDDLINTTSNEYKSLLEATKSQIIATRISVSRSANSAQIKLYWWIGEQIHAAQEKYGWGNSIVDTYAKDLTNMFPGSGFGFSARNIWEMRRFYLAYKDFPNLQRLVAEIPWGQNLTILSKIKDYKEREYYLELTKKSSNLLSINIIHGGRGQFNKYYEY